LNDYKTQVAHCTGSIEEVIRNNPAFDTPQIWRAMIEDLLSAIRSYEGDKYKRDFRVVRCPEGADEYAIVDLESYDYSIDDVEIVGGLGYHDSYRLAGKDDEEEEAV